MPSIVVSPNGKYLVVSAGEGYYLLDSVNGEIITHNNNGGGVNAAVFSLDNQYFVIGNYDGTVHLLKTDIGRKIRSLIQSSDGFAKNISIAFSPDGKYLATSGGINNPARIWDISTGLEVYHFLRDDGVGSFAFSPDGKYLALISYRNANGNLFYVSYVLEIASGKNLVQIEHGDSYRGALNFSPDGRYLITNESVWMWQPENIITNACTYLPRNLTRAEWAQFIGDAMPYQAVCENLPIEPEVTSTTAATP